MLVSLIQIVFNKTKGSFISNLPNGTGTEHIVPAKHFRTVSVGFCLIFTREVQVNIRHFVTAEAKECFEGNIKALLCKRRTAFGTYCIRQVCTTLIPRRHIKSCILAIFVGATVMGWEGVNFRDAGHKCYDGRSNRATGTNKIAVIQRILHQSLCRDVNNVVMTTYNIMQFHFHTLLDKFRRVVTIKTVHFFIHQLFQILSGILNGGRKQIVGYRTNQIAHISDHIGICNNHFVCFFLS